MPTVDDLQAICLEENQGGLEQKLQSNELESDRCLKENAEHRPTKIPASPPSDQPAEDTKQPIADSIQPTNKFTYQPRFTYQPSENIQPTNELTNKPNTGRIDQDGGSKFWDKDMKHSIVRGFVALVTLVIALLKLRRWRTNHRAVIPAARALPSNNGYESIDNPINQSNSQDLEIEEDSSALNRQDKSPSPIANKMGGESKFCAHSLEVESKNSKDEPTKSGSMLG